MLRVLFILLLILNVSHAKMFQSVKISDGTFVQKGDSKFYCPNCGMYLPKFHKTNHIHKNHQYCSLHCLVEATKGEIPDDVKVVDAKSIKLIDAKSAYYVVGSKKRGTMSMVSKYAFASKKDALEFQKKYGGKILDFKKAYEIAKDALKKELMMMRIKNEKVVYNKGKKLYKTKCKQIKNIQSLNTIADLKAKLKKECSLKKDKQLQMVAIYLWEIEKENIKIAKKETIKVPKDANCPICGMFVYKYPKWAAMLDMDNGKKLYFDGVKDMVKYILAHKDEIDRENAYVTGYFTSMKIKASDAYFVFGSNVYGPMGNELIPFKTEISANAFKKDHYGKKVYAFYEIDEDIMEELEEL